MQKPSLFNYTAITIYAAVTNKKEKEKEKKGKKPDTKKAGSGRDKERVKNTHQISYI